MEGSGVTFYEKEDVLLRRRDDNALFEIFDDGRWGLYPAPEREPAVLSESEAAQWVASMRGITTRKATVMLHA